MKTQLELAREGIITEAMKEAAAYDDVSRNLSAKVSQKGRSSSMETQIGRRVWSVLVKDSRQR